MINIVKHMLDDARTYDSFDDWLTSLPTEDLQYLSSITDKVDNQVDSHKAATDEELYALSQICALGLYFQGKTEASEEESFEAYGLIATHLAIELNVRNGMVEKRGKYSMADDDEAEMRLTPKGRRHVETLGRMGELLGGTDKGSK